MSLIAKDVKPLERLNDLYQDDEASELEIEEKQNPNYDFDMDESDNEAERGEQDLVLSKEEELRIHQELMFFIQGVGSIKNINGYDVYVKH